MLRGKFTLLFMMLGLLLAIPAVALADDLRNNLDGTFEADFELLNLQTGQVPAQTQTVNIVLQGQGSDGDGGCNIDSGEGPITVKAKSSNSSAASVKWVSTNNDTVNFTDCAAPNSKNLVVTAGSAGSADVTFEITNGTATATPGVYTVSSIPGGGTYDVRNGQFRVSVAPPPNTPPSVAVTGVAHGAIYDKGTVPAAGCSVSDAEDTGESATPVTDSSALDSDGLGSETVTCSYTDGGGLKETASATYSIVDPSAPVITKVVTPESPDGSNGWYTSDVKVEWTVSDPESPNSIQTTGCVDQNITADQAATTYTCSATSAGGSAPEQSVTIKRDATAPVITDDGRKTQPNADGWYASEAFNKFSASDATSGLADSTKASFEEGTGTQEGSGLTVDSGPVSDNAGNTAASKTSTATYNVDLSDPTNVAFVGGPAAGSSHDFGSVPAAPTCTADDDVSGLKNCVVTDSNAGGTGAVGSHTLTATATDKAGRTATATRTYTVAAASAKGFYSPVDMGNFTNTVKGGSTVPLKFELFGGATNTEQKALSAVSSVSAKQIPCGTTPGSSDAIEEIVSTNASGLRFDTTGDQFIYNWKTPKSPGTCYIVTMTAADQQTKLIAYFKLS
jgi:hypothetical protein